MKECIMPLVKIEMVKEKDRNFVLELMKTVMDCVRDVFQLPPDDRNVRLIEYERDVFTMKKPYSLLIEISMFAGRSKETKKHLYETIVKNLNEKLSIDKNAIFILLNEQPLYNWGVRGGIPADEVNLGFKVDI
jgi:phenylpyruvate tautomerase PptA (4-oxalocrotonate tautomerase family)